MIEWKIRDKLTASANSGIGSGNLYSAALVTSLLVDENGKVENFLLPFTEGNGKRCLHVIEWVCAKHNEGNEEEEMRKDAKEVQEVILQTASVFFISSLVPSTSIPKLKYTNVPLNTQLLGSSYIINHYYIYNLLKFIY